MHGPTNSSEAGIFRLRTARCWNEVFTLQEASKFRSTSNALLLAGLCMTMFGIALTHSFPPGNANAAIGERFHPRESIRLAPIVAGGLLLFVSVVRLSLLMRPRNMLVLGMALVFGAVLVPVAVSTYLPAAWDSSWTGAVLEPLFIARILGLILLSTGILRGLSRDGPRG